MTSLSIYCSCCCLPPLPHCLANTEMAIIMSLCLPTILAGMTECCKAPAERNMAVLLRDLLPVLTSQQWHFRKGPVVTIYSQIFVYLRCIHMCVGDKCWYISSINTDLSTHLLQTHFKVRYGQITQPHYICMSLFYRLLNVIKSQRKDQ